LPSSRFVFVLPPRLASVLLGWSHPDSCCSHPHSSAHRRMTRGSDNFVQFPTLSAWMFVCCRAPGKHPSDIVVAGTEISPNRISMLCGSRRFQKRCNACSVSIGTFASVSHRISVRIKGQYLDFCHQRGHIMFSTDNQAFFVRGQKMPNIRPWGK
jgi:hypothetical protein